MTLLKRIVTPVYGTADIEANSFIAQIQTMLRHEKEDSKHFDRKFVHYSIVADEHNMLWLAGWTKKDLKNT